MEEKITIGEFIEQNDKLLAVLGIFLGVAAFASNAQIKIVGQIVAFLLVLAALLIWSELFFRFRTGKHPDKRLTFFFVILIVAFLATVLYWMLEFNSIMRLALAGVLLETLYIHIKGLHSLQGSRWNKFFIWFALLLLTAFLATTINRSLDRFRNYLLSKQAISLSK